MLKLKNILLFEVVINNLFFVYLNIFTKSLLYYIKSDLNLIKICETQSRPVNLYGITQYTESNFAHANIECYIRISRQNDCYLQQIYSYIMAKHELRYQLDDSDSCFALELQADLSFAYYAQLLFATSDIIFNWLKVVSISKKQNYMDNSLNQQYTSRKVVTIRYIILISNIRKFLFLNPTVSVQKKRLSNFIAVLCLDAIYCIQRGGVNIIRDLH